MAIENDAGDGPFYIGKGRAMVSLGPINPKRHCPFRCPFCYVENPEFLRYETWPAEKIAAWIQERIDQIEVIYVSGDTDSFAPPRTRAGIELLEELSKLKRDLLFTTRHVFSQATHWKQLKNISRQIRRTNHLAIACVSVCQWSVPRLEPHPIQTPKARIEQLGELNAAGWVPVLAMRPIMPNVPETDLEQILKLSAPYTRYCLISDYYFAPNTPQWQPEVGKGFDTGRLYFDLGPFSGWKRLSPSKPQVRLIRKLAAELEMQVYQDSADLYEALKEQYQ